MKYDKIIIGAGLYGLYAAHFLGTRGKKVLVLECDTEAFMRATYINQARVHQGYHYPRSLSTAMKSAGYFERFSKDYAFCINGEFKKIYATSAEYSWSDAMQFKSFCRAAGIFCEELQPDNYFKEGLCDGAFLTREYTYDARILRDYFLEKIAGLSNVEIWYGVRITAIEKTSDSYIIHSEKIPEDAQVANQPGKNTVDQDNESHTDNHSTRGHSKQDEVHGQELPLAESSFLLNATYAGTNQILDMLGYELFRIKYELCEIILCKASDTLREYGFTVMDGPFFSIMPFGKTGLHSLTSVTFTPHTTSYDSLPQFACQEHSRGTCSRTHLGNCNTCPARPATAFPYMASLARKYLKDEYSFSYKESLFSMKPILMSSEIDDSRPTVVRTFGEGATCVAVLSGKINTVYDLDEVLSKDE